MARCDNPPSGRRGAAGESGDAFGGAFRARWLAVFLLVAALFPLSGWWYYRAEAENVKREKYKDIAAIGRLKAAQIGDWRNERLAGSRRTAGSPFFRRAIEEYLSAPESPGLRDDLLARLLLEREAHAYSDVVLLDPDGKILLAAREDPAPPHPAVLRAAERARASGEAVFADIYRCVSGAVHVDVVVPVPDAGGNPLCMLVSRGDAEGFLFPLLVSWPVPTRSAETLLIVREGEEAVILNRPRHWPAADPVPRYPLIEEDLAVVQAVLGRRGVFVGRDYRGVTVLADLEAVSGSPWFLVAQIDLDEVQEQLRNQAGMIALFVLLGILLAAAVFAYLYRRHQAKFFLERLRIERQRLEAEESLEESRQMLRLILDTYPVRIFWKDRDSVYRGCNLSFASDAGLGSPEEIVGKRDQDMGWAEQAEAYRADDRFVIESGRPKLNYEEPLTMPDGRKILVRTSKIPLRDADGNIIGVLGTYEDMTESRRAENERRELEARLRQAQKMEAIGRLAGGVAHDFNNVLGIIIGHAGLALSRVEPGDPLRADIEEIMKAGRRSADLVRQLLGFARTQIIAPKVLDLNDTIAGMFKMLKRLIGENIELIWKPAPELDPVRMDPVQIDQILANLVVNARDAISGRGVVTVETGMVEFDEDFCRMHAGFIPGRYVMLAVADDGCGMDEDTRARIFEPFFTTKWKGEGTGLGLATVYGIVKQNRGFIDVESEAGRGTRCRIFLPPCEPREARTSRTAEKGESSAGSETVLLVEDEEALLRLYRTQLEQLGYTVLAAGSPREALRLAAEYAGEIDLLVSDVVMPEMNGRELWGRLKTMRPGLKYLFISGYSAEIVAHHGVLDEGLRFLSKPFSSQELAAKIREALCEA